MRVGSAHPSALLHSPKRASPGRARVGRGFAKPGTETNFVSVCCSAYLCCGGCQKLCRPLRAITIADRFTLVWSDPAEHNMRMLGVSELKTAMGFNGGRLINCGTYDEDITILDRYVYLPVMHALVRRIGIT